MSLWELKEGIEWVLLVFPGVYYVGLHIPPPLPMTSIEDPFFLGRVCVCVGDLSSKRYYSQN